MVLTGYWKNPVPFFNCQSLCNFCAKTFGHHGSLKIHITGVHENVKEHGCKKCNLSFVSSNNLDKHTKAVHLNIKPYQCDICQKDFAQNANLKSHIKEVHSKMNDVKVEWNTIFNYVEDFYCSLSKLSSFDNLGT